MVVYLNALLCDENLKPPCIRPTLIIHKILQVKLPVSPVVPAGKTRHAPASKGVKSRLLFAFAAFKYVGE